MTVTVRDQTLTARAGADGSWQVTPTPLAIGPVSIRASTDVDGETVMAAPDPLGITITPQSVRIDAPLDGTTTRQRRPVIGGSGAEPGADVLVALDDEQLIAEVGDDGRWAGICWKLISPSAHALRARQVMWEVSSDTVISRFSVVGSTVAAAHHTDDLRRHPHRRPRRPRPASRPRDPPPPLRHPYGHTDPRCGARRPPGRARRLGPPP